MEFQEVDTDFGKIRILRKEQKGFNSYILQLVTEKNNKNETLDYKDIEEYELSQTKVKELEEALKDIRKEPDMVSHLK